MAKGAAIDILSDSDSDDDRKPSTSKAPAAAKKPPKSTSASSSKSKKAATKTTKIDVDDDSYDVKPKKEVPRWVQAKSRAQAGPANPGSKAIPEGTDDCLAGLTLVFTGELESLSREEAQELAKRYGARVTSAPSGKTSYVVVGANAGPGKLAKIKEKGLKTVDEDGFLALIGSNTPAPEADVKYQEKKKAEERKVKEGAKRLEQQEQAAPADALWTVKYAPRTLKDVCGNTGNVEKIKAWLENYRASLRSGFKKAGKDGTGAFRALLIYGPPGIGKTTAAHLCARLAGYSVIELNASDTRSKKLLETAYKTTVDNTFITGYFKNDAGSLGDKDLGLGFNQNTVIVMDEVDGMSSGDRGGVGALKILIKKTRVPIIAIANDGNSQKMRPLSDVCFKMHFIRPQTQMIRARMMQIAFREKLAIPPNVMDQLVSGSGADIRQVINMLSTWKLGANSMDFDQGKELVALNEKSAMETPFSLYSKLSGPYAFSATSRATLTDKLELYFTDYSFLPLFVQENYLKATQFARANRAESPQEKELLTLELASKAADSISDGDLVDRMIHGSQQQWSLMPAHGILSCVRPMYHVYGQGGGFPAFPAWLGKNSMQNRMLRQLSEVQTRMKLRSTLDRNEIRQSYFRTLVDRMYTPLHIRGPDAIKEVIQFMDEYFLSKEEWDFILELGVGAYNGETLLGKLNSQTKGSFTRAYNQGHHPIAYHKGSTSSAPVKKLGGGEVPDLENIAPEDDEGGDDDAAADDDDDDDLTKDKLIKPKKAAAAKGRGAAKRKAAKDSASTASPNKKAKTSKK